VYGPATGFFLPPFPLPACLGSHLVVSIPRTESQLGQGISPFSPSFSPSHFLSPTAFLRGVQLVGHFVTYDDFFFFYCVVVGKGKFLYFFSTADTDVVRKKKGKGKVPRPPIFSFKLVLSPCSLGPKARKNQLGRGRTRRLPSFLSLTGTFFSGRSRLGGEVASR